MKDVFFVSELSSSKIQEIEKFEKENLKSFYVSLYGIVRKNGFDNIFGKFYLFSKTNVPLNIEKIKENFENEIKKKIINKNQNNVNTFWFDTSNFRENIEDLGYDFIK